MQLGRLPLCQLSYSRPRCGNGTAAVGDEPVIVGYLSRCGPLSQRRLIPGPGRPRHSELRHGHARRSRDAARRSLSGVPRRPGQGVSMPSDSVSPDCRVNLSVSDHGDDHDDGTRATAGAGPRPGGNRGPVDGRGGGPPRSVRASGLAVADRACRGRPGRTRPRQPGSSRRSAERGRAIGSPSLVSANFSWPRPMAPWCCRRRHRR